MNLNNCDSNLATSPPPKVVQNCCWWTRSFGTFRAILRLFPNRSETEVEGLVTSSAAPRNTYQCRDEVEGLLSLKIGTCYVVAGAEELCWVTHSRENRGPWMFCRSNLGNVAVLEVKLHKRWCRQNPLRQIELVDFFEQKVSVFSVFGVFRFDETEWKELRRSLCNSFVSGAKRVMMRGLKRSKLIWSTSCRCRSNFSMLILLSRWVRADRCEIMMMWAETRLYFIWIL